MDVTIEKRLITEEELILDVFVGKQDLIEFSAQGYDSIMNQRGVVALEGESAKEACERVLSEPIATELLCGAVMNMSYPFARSEVGDVVTIGAPSLTPRGKMNMDEGFRYTARWAKLPQVELSSYDPVTIKAPAKHASDDMIDQQLAQIAASYARFEPVAEVRPVQAGDQIRLSLHVELDGEPVGGLCFDENNYTLGVGAMPEEFERNVQGMKPGEFKSFDFSGIADFDADEQPVLKTYHADVTVKTLLERGVPDLTDAWVKVNVPNCDSVAALRETIREQIDAKVAAERRHYLNYIAASELAKRFSGRIPDVAYEAVREEMQEQSNLEARQMGLTMEEYMKRQGVDEQQYSIRMILQIRERLVQAIALDAFARHFDINVNDSDLEEFFKVSAPEGMATQFRHQLEGSGRMYLAYEGARRLKANDLLVSQATIIEDNVR